MAKTFRILALFITVISLTIACGGEKDTTTSKAANNTSADTKTKEVSADNSNRKGKLIYKQYCIICHGADGKLAISNATDLSKSTLPVEERVNQITNGKGLMTPYKDILSKDQILAVAEYLEELRK